MLRVTVGPTPCIDAALLSVRRPYRCCALLSVRLPVSMLCYCRWLISRVQCSVSVVSTLVTSSVHWGQECSLTVTLETVLMRLLQVTMHSCESWFILITSSPSSSLFACVCVCLLSVFHETTCSRHNKTFIIDEESLWSCAAPCNEAPGKA